MGKIKVYVDPKWLEKNLKAFNENNIFNKHLWDVDVIIADGDKHVNDFEVIVEKEK